MAETFAIAYKSDPTRIVCWCDNRGRTSNGGRRFTVINGGWNGHITPAGDVMAGDMKLGDGVIVWEGTVPAPERYSYNTAIPWIQEQLKGGQ